MEMNIWLFLVLSLGVSGLVRVAPLGSERQRILASLLVLLAFMCWAPFVLDNFRLIQMTRIATLGLALLGLNILTGYNGQVSLGHGAFVLMGAYTVAVLLDRNEQLNLIDATPWPFWATIFVAGFLAAAAGLVIGVPALRLSGPYLAIATLAVMISMPIIVRKYGTFTGGSQGLGFSRPPPPPFLEDLLRREQWLYFLCLLALVVMTFLAWNLLRGQFGRSLQAVRDSEVAAAAMGIHVARVKVLAFVISAFYAGVAGALLALISGIVNPETVDIVQSINYLAGIVIGGLASIMGSLIGAAAIVFIPSDAASELAKLPFLDANMLRRAPGAIQGAVVIVVMLLMPYGVAGAAHRLLRLRPERALARWREAPALARGALQRASWAWDLRPRSAGQGPGQNRPQGEVVSHGEGGKATDPEGDLTKGGQ